MNQQAIYMKSKGGGQFFKCLGEQVTIVCLYEFNPLIEKTRMRPDTLGKLACDPVTVSEFDTAFRKCISMLSDDSRESQTIDLGKAEILAD